MPPPAPTPTASAQEFEAHASSKSREVRSPGHAGSCCSLARPGATPMHSSRKKELRLPACPRRKDAPARPATGTPAAARPPHLPSSPSLQLPLSRRHHRRRGGQCSASYSSASWDARCRADSELSEDQPMELHFLLVRLCGGRLSGEASANRGEERRG